MYCFYYTFLSLKKQNKANKPHSLPSNKKKRRKKICFNKYDVRKPDQYVDRPIGDYAL